MKDDVAVNEVKKLKDMTAEEIVRLLEKMTDGQKADLATIITRGRKGIILEEDESIVEEDYRLPSNQYLFFRMRPGTLDARALSLLADYGHVSEEAWEIAGTLLSTGVQGNSSLLSEDRDYSELLADLDAGKPAPVYSKISAMVRRRHASRI